MSLHTFVMRKNLHDLDYFCLKSRLLNPNFNIDLRDKDGYTPLHLAVISNNHEFVRYLILHGANMNIEVDGLNSMHLAARGTADVLMLNLLGNLINSKDVNGNTPLHHAAMYSNYEKVEFLLRHGADTFIKNNKGKYAHELTNEPFIRDLILEYQELPDVKGAL